MIGKPYQKSGIYQIDICRLQIHTINFNQTYKNYLLARKNIKPEILNLAKHLLENKQNFNNIGPLKEIKIMPK